MEVAQPFASDLMARRSSSGNTVFDELGRQAAQASNTALGLPRRLDETIDKLERGDLRVRVRSIESDRILRRLSGIQQGTNYTLIASTLTLSATILLVNGYAILAGVVVVGAAGAGFAFWRLVRRLDRMDRMS
jgi:vacuolar-type H+-ATPase subunit E/Vma4